jgi:hypothetical protein
MPSKTGQAERMCRWLVASSRIVMYSICLFGRLYYMRSAQAGVGPGM